MLRPFHDTSKVPVIGGVLFVFLTKTTGLNIKKFNFVHSINYLQKVMLFIPQFPKIVA